jgi:hypothetical protein
MTVAESRDFTDFGARPETVAGQLKEAACAEQALSLYSNNLSSLIKNGSARKKLSYFKESTAIIRDVLLARLKNLGVSDVCPEDFILRPESFSTIGMLNQSLEMAETAVRTYRSLLKNAGRGERAFFKKLLKEKCRELRFLTREKRFHEKRDSSLLGMRLSLSRPLSFS